MLTCSTCRQAMPEGNFWRQPSKRSGYQAECKFCQARRNREWFQAHPEQARAHGRRGMTAKRLRDPRHALFMSAKARAAKKGVPFTIALKDLVFPEICPVLGIPLTFGLGEGMSMGLALRDTRTSIDRIDNTKGYEPGNIVIVSYRANRLKSDATIAELREIVRFYDGLEANANGQTYLSAVQPSEEKQEGSLPQCVA